MKIYMAGGVSGNLKPFWKMVSSLLSKGWKYDDAFNYAMKLFLAGTESRHWILKDYADLYGRDERNTQDSCLNIRGGADNE